MLAPYWTMPAIYSLHIINMTYLKLIMVQRRAARFVTGNYDWNVSVTSMLQHLRWEPLQTRQNNIRIITMYIYNSEQLD